MTKSFPLPVVSASPSKLMKSTADPLLTLPQRAISWHKNPHLNNNFQTHTLTTRRCEAIVCDFQDPIKAGVASDLSIKTVSEPEMSAKVFTRWLEHPDCCYAALIFFFFQETCFKTRQHVRCRYNINYQLIHSHSNLMALSSGAVSVVTSWGWEQALLQCFMAEVGWIRFLWVRSRCTVLWHKWSIIVKRDQRNWAGDEMWEYVGVALL